MYQSKKELRYFKPDLVIGTGGYVSGPVLYQAVKKLIPTAIQEQNSYPGITTRILAGKVDHVFLAYEESLKHLKKISRYSIVGNPVQLDLSGVMPDEARKFFNLKKNKTTILIFGGSQGADNINRTIDRLLAQDVFKDMQLIWQTGSANFEYLQEKYKNNRNTDMCLLPFIDRMDYAYRISDFAICRAGAMTVSELAAAGLPAILIPLSHAAANHQFKNARSIAAGGGAIIVKDRPDMDGELAEVIHRLCDSEKLRKEMSRKISGFHKPDTLEKIAAELKKLYDKNLQ
jgi:UDP-N-acetylglucosamine--N-acetylmuramyl-(pentapeptide) pyrophosphoryl-undecaprenol N-acetylglucosamine transferase